MLVLLVTIAAAPSTGVLVAAFQIIPPTIRIIPGRHPNYYWNHHHNNNNYDSPFTPPPLTLVLSSSTQRRRQQLELFSSGLDPQHFLTKNMNDTTTSSSSTTTTMGNTMRVAATNATTTTTTTRLRIVSYNVLSSHLATPSSYPTYPVEHLDATRRLHLILQKLQSQMTTTTTTTKPPSSSPSSLSNHDTTDIDTDTTDRRTKTIFCLQEVSYEWAGHLHTFFANHGYHVVTGLYGKPFNGYMGVLTAYPTAYFTTIQTDICRLADTYPSWPSRSSTTGSSSSSSSSTASPHTGTWWPWSWFTPVVTQMLGGLVSPPPVAPTTTPECHWNSAQRRYNVLLTVILAEKPPNHVGTSNHHHHQFVVSNYHMPCVYYDERVMVLHSDLCLSRVQQLAQYQEQNDNDEVATAAAETSSSLSSPPPPANDTATATNEPTPAPSHQKTRTQRPYILAGDFNIKPNDTAYRLLTTGHLDRHDPAYPTPPPAATTTPKNSSDTVREEWQPRQMEAVRSAYAVHAAATTTTETEDKTTAPHHSSGTGEPDFTNFSQMGDTPFIDTLDYIFISPNHDDDDNENGNRIVVRNVLPLPHRDEVMKDGPYPNAVEPSDHVLIAADLDIQFGATTTMNTNEHDGRIDE